MKGWQAGIASTLLGIAIWQAIVTIGDLQKFILPGPALVAETLWKSRVFILENAWITLTEVLLGLVLGALIGGITGFATAVTLTGLTALAYPLVTQGKPILSWPAYFVIMFEMTILFTGLFGFAGVLHHTRKPGRLSPQYREAFSVDRFGIFVPAAEAQRPEIEKLMRDAGAVEVEVAG